MEAFIYIIFSKKLNRYYIGSTQLIPTQRLELHLSKFYGNSKYTAKTNDWKLCYSIKCDSISQARKIEMYLKKMRNRKYLEWIISEPTAVEKIKSKFI
jgi:putative endonuclease